MTTITLPRAVAEQALEALESVYGDSCDALHALRAALAQQAEAVQEICPGCEATLGAACGRESCPKGWEAAPPQRKPLTDEEIDRVTDQQWSANNHKPVYAAHRAYARAVERAHGIGEGA